MPHTPHNENKPLLDAEGKSKTELSTQPISSTLWATNTLSYLRIATGAADTIDIGCLVYAVAKGHVGKSTGGLFGAGAVVFMGLGAWGLRGL